MQIIEEMYYDFTDKRNNKTLYDSEMAKEIEDRGEKQYIWK